MNETNNKDYYLPVLIKQIVISLFLLILIYLFGTRGDFSKNYLELIDKNYDSLELNNAIETIKEHIYAGDIFTVLNISDDFPSDYDTTTSSTGAGGKDIKGEGALKNASFAPVFSTAQILSPIEKGRYTSYFGYRINPITGEYGFHSGLDIAASENTKIRAAFNGEVIKCGYDAQAGNYIYLSHSDDFVTFYCHCNELLVEKGTIVRQGETIALVGSTGYSTGPHLHFEIRKNNIRYNPLWLLEK